MAYYDEEVLNNYNDNLLTNASYNVYLDQNGYFVGVDLFEGDSNYVFITGYDMRSSNLSVKTAEASGIFLDGTMKTMTVNVTDTNKNISKLYNKDANGDDTTPKSAYYVKWENHISDGVYLLNRWYTYTETNGVYTLKPCYDAKNGDILMMASNVPTTANNGKTTQETLTMKCDRVTLDSVTKDTVSIADGNTSTNDVKGLFQGETMTYTNGVTAGGGDKNNNGALHSARAYGEDDSVFITVDTDKVSARVENLSITNAITDVAGVYTGVQNVELIVKATDRIKGEYYTTGGDLSNHNGTNKSASVNFGENVYTVYDKDHFIIGSIVLGSAKGGVENYAYILDPVKSEEKIDDTYYWEFEAVFHGEIVTMTAKSKYLSTINTLKDNKYKIVELRLDGDYVTEVETIKPAEIYGDTFAEIYDYIDEENVYDVTLNDDSRWERITGRVAANNGTGTLYLQGRTLYVLDSRADKGLTFTSDAKAVVRQLEGESWENTEFTSVESAVAWLADANNDPDNGKQFNGVISAVLNSQGVAEWVVFYTDTKMEIGANRDPVAPSDPDANTEMTLQIWVTMNGVKEQVPNSTTKYMKSRYPATVSAPDVGPEWVPDRAVKSTPAFSAGDTKSVVFNFTKVGDGSTVREDDKGDVPALSETIKNFGAGNGKPNENESFDKDTFKAGIANGGIVKDTKEGSATNGQTFIGTDAKNAFESALEAEGVGIYHYTQEMKDLFGWNQTSFDNGLVWFQIGKDEPAWQVVLLVVDLGAGNGTNGYTLYLDGTVVADELWNSADKAGTRFLAWDNIPVGAHTYKLVKNADSSDPNSTDVVIQWGDFEIVRP